MLDLNILKKEDSSRGSVGPSKYAWRFSEIDCKVSSDMLMGFCPGDPEAASLQQLQETFEIYLARLYLRLYPIFDRRTNAALRGVWRLMRSVASEERKLLVVDCHGSRRTDGWFLVDNGEHLHAEEYLLQFDGIYSCIMCFACNVTGCEPELKRSALIFFHGNTPFHHEGYHRFRREGSYELRYKIPGHPSVLMRMGLKEVEAFFGEYAREFADTSLDRFNIL